MSDGQNDITCLDILTKYIKLMDLQGYMASVCLLLSEKKLFLKVNHIKQDLSSLVETSIRHQKGVETNWLSWVGIFRVGIVRVGVILGGNCPSWSYPGWEFSRWKLSWVEIFLGANFPGGNCPVVIIWVGVFLVL